MTAQICVQISVVSVVVSPLVYPFYLSLCLENKRSFLSVGGSNVPSTHRLDTIN